MKKLVGFLSFLTIAISLQAQETHQFVATAPDDAPNGGFGNAILLLTGQHLVMTVEASPTYSQAAIHGPAAPGADAPIIYDFGQLSGAADSCCGATVELDLTLEQTQQLRQACGICCSTRPTVARFFCRQLADFKERTPSNWRPLSTE